MNTLNSTALTTDLGVSITGNKNTLNIGDTVKLTIKAFNNGPNNANVKLNYKIPSGLKLLSSQGDETYNSTTGIWNVGGLPVGGNATMELTLQANNAGHFVNTVTIYSDLSDLNPADNQAKFNLITSGNADDIPPIILPVDPSIYPQIPPSGSGGSGGSGGSFGGSGGSGGSGGPGGSGPGGSGPGGSSNLPNTQLARDISWIRGTLSSDSSGSSSSSSSSNNRGSSVIPTVPPWVEDEPPEPTQEEYEAWVNTVLKLSLEVLFFVGIELASSKLGQAGEYLGNVVNKHISNPEILGTVLNWFGKTKYTKTVLKSLGDANRALKNPTFEKIAKGFDFIIQKVGFNYGMEVFKTLLTKLFPKQADKIGTIMKMITYGEFITDPLGAPKAISDVIISMLWEGELPDRENFEKVFIFKPFQDPNA